MSQVTTLDELRRQAFPQAYQATSQALQQPTPQQYIISAPVATQQNCMQTAPQQVFSQPFPQQNQPAPQQASQQGQQFFQQPTPQFTQQVVQQAPQQPQFVPQPVPQFTIQNAPQLPQLAQQPVVPQANQTAPQPVEVSLNTVDGYKTLMQEAELFAKSTLVPLSFQNKLENCAIALDMAYRLKVDPLLLMQNIYVLQGKPGFTSAFLIAVVNKSNRFSTIEYEFIGNIGNDDFGCRAKVIEISNNKEHIGPWVTIQMAKQEGWYQNKRNKVTGTPILSKWQTMPELMLRYRAAAFLIRTTFPELIMGLQTEEEIKDVLLENSINITSFAEEKVHAPIVENTVQKAQPVHLKTRGRPRKNPVPTQPVQDIPATPVADTLETSQNIIDVAVQEPQEQPQPQAPVQVQAQPQAQDISATTIQPTTSQANNIPPAWQDSIIPTSTVNVNDAFEDLCETHNVNLTDRQTLLNAYMQKHNVNMNGAKLFFVSNSQIFETALQQLSNQ